MATRSAKKTVAKKAASQPLTVEDIDRMMVEVNDVWRKRRPLPRKSGVPVKPGAARLFMHSF